MSSVASDHNRIKTTSYFVRPAWCDGSKGWILLSTVLQLTCINGYQYFQDKIPNGDRVPNPCAQGPRTWDGVGHQLRAGSGARNPFGLDFAQNNFEWDQCLCQYDSDGDGLSNGLELGDPDCVWTQGQTPTAREQITHPGICEPMDDPDCQEKNSWLDCSTLVPFQCDAFHDPETERIDLTIEPAAIPAQETTYACTALVLSEDLWTRDVHVIGAKPLINNTEIMHHMIVYGCPDDRAPYAMEAYGNTSVCGTMVWQFCPEMVYIWTYGLEGDCFSDKLGIRIGLNGYKTFALEFHWNNPRELPDQYDASGVSFYYTPKLRQYDSQNIFLGPWIMEIPPSRPDYRVLGHCPSVCTEYMFPQTVYIPQIVPHMHYLGRKLVVRQIRNGTEFSVLVNETNYNYNFPKVHKYEPSIEVQPGDELSIECIYDTTFKQEITYWGESTSDEMCIAAITYYPKQPETTDCLNFQIDMGTCGFSWGEENLGLCFDFWSNGTERKNFRKTTFWDFYEALKQNCDLTGQSCLPGCNETVSRIRQHPCFNSDIDGWTKHHIIRDMEGRRNGNEDYTARQFNNAMASCNQRYISSIVEKSTESGDVTGYKAGLCFGDPVSDGTGHLHADNIVLASLITAHFLMFIHTRL